MARAADMADGWVILRMAGPRTLPVARSLAAAGFEVWTPVDRVSKRRSGGRTGKVVVDAPMAPTIVFARANRRADLHAITRLPVSPHPPFSLFLDTDRTIVAVSDASLERMRDFERHRPRPRPVGQPLAKGQKVGVPGNAFAALKLEVDASNERRTLLFFGSMRMNVRTLRLHTDVVQGEHSSGTDMAA